MATLASIYEELGAPAPTALFVAARKRGLNVSREEARQFTMRRGERQIFNAAKPSEGKVVAEDVNARYQADLLDFKNDGGGAEKNVLVVVNVFTREMWARAIKNKTAAKTAEALRDILDDFDVNLSGGSSLIQPLVMTTDGGAEFTADFAEELKDRKIAHRLKDGKNSIAVVDRAVGSLKLTLAKMMATRSGSWRSMLQDAVEALNKQPKAVLHNETPEQVSSNEQVTFMLLQDGARNLVKNKALQERRTRDLQAAGAFRAPAEGLGRKTFKRGTDPSYGEKKTLQAIEGSTAVATDGTRVDVKYLQAVQGESTEVTARLGNLGETKSTAKKREIAGPLRDAARAYIRSRENTSIQALAFYLKRELRAATLTFQQIIDKTKVRNLAALLRLFPAVFEIEGQWVTVK
jgi:hypothetical protein